MSIKRRTQDDVVDYIKSHASEGKLQESLIGIAESLGYSNATIHRALKSLQEQGVIEVLPPERPTQPNTIIYNGPVHDLDQVASQGVELMNEIQRLGVKVAEYVRESQSIIACLKEQSGEMTSDIESRITEVVDMPDGKHQMLIVRKVDEHIHQTDSKDELQTQ